MATVTDVLHEFSGPYQYGVRDCCTVAAAIAEAGGTCRPDYSRYCQLPEPQAVAAGIRDHGTVAAAHAAVLTAAGMVDGVLPLCAGDIVLLSGVETASDGTTVGYVADSCEVVAWTPRGLRPLRGEVNIDRVLRCRPS